MRRRGPFRCRPPTGIDPSALPGCPPGSNDHRLEQDSSRDGRIETISENAPRSEVAPSQLRRPGGGCPVSTVGNSKHLKRLRNSLPFEIRRIEHPDDAIVKITVRTPPGMVSAGGD